VIDQAAIAADEAVERMRRLRAQVQQQRAESAKQFAQAREQNKQVSEKAIADGQAQREGRPQPAQPLPEERHPFFDQEDEYTTPPPPSFSMPEIPPPPRPTPRRAARPVFADEDDYSNQSWLE
jgi:hypothetical protein